MIEHEATRTLVKSQPEVWAQCSEADSLGRHLSGSFGEIRITRLEPEHAVVWEGQEVSGTVRIEPSAWGTRVTLTVETEEEVEGSVVEPVLEAVPSRPPVEPDEPPEPASEGIAGPDAESSPVTAPEASAFEPTAAPTWLARLRSWWRREPEPAASAAEPPEPPRGPQEEARELPPPQAEAAQPEAPAPERESQDPDTTAALNAALESLGQAHHRPFSRG